MKLLPRALSGLALTLLVLAGCRREDETPVVKGVAIQYWDFLFQGKTRAAYEMLDSESKGFVVYPDYARSVGLYPSQIKEVQDYWDVYYPQTLIEVESAVINYKDKTAVVSLTLTQPDPRWFPDEAVVEAEEKGLEGPEKARFVLSKLTEALKQGIVPQVKIAENTKLVKEEEEWKVVYAGEERG